MVDIKILSLFIFIKVNEKVQLRKIMLNDILLFNQILIQEAKRLNLDYKSNISTTFYTEINYNSNNILHCNEESHGYVIKLASDIDLDILKEQIASSYEYLDRISCDIDLNYIFVPDVSTIMNRIKK